MAGIDYAEINDWASVNLHFRVGAQRFDINHSWVCLQSRSLSRIVAPWRSWAEAGKLTVVDDVSIDPNLLADYLKEMGLKYNIVKLSMGTSAGRW